MIRTGQEQTLARLVEEGREQGRYEPQHGAGIRTDVGDSGDDAQHDRVAWSVDDQQPRRGHEADEQRFDKFGAQVVGDRGRDVVADQEKGFEEAVGHQLEKSLSYRPAFIEHHERQRRHQQVPSQKGLGPVSAVFGERVAEVLPPRQQRVGRMGGVEKRVTELGAGFELAQLEDRGREAFGGAHLERDPFLLEGGGGPERDASERQSDDGEDEGDRERARDSRRSITATQGEWIMPKTIASMSGAESEGFIASISAAPTTWKKARNSSLAIGIPTQSRVRQHLHGA